MADAIEGLIDRIDDPNLADGMTEEEWRAVANKCVLGYEIDEESRVEWVKQTEAGLAIAEQVADKKSWPWEGASNVKYPLIATSAIQFAARAYPSIIQGNEIVKAKVIGEDKDNAKADRAKRVSQHMSWQLSEGMEDWDEGMDQLLHSLPVVGTIFKKTYYDTLMQTNRSDLCQPLDVVVHMDTKSLKTCRRVTHKIKLYKNDVIERERLGTFTDFDADYMIDRENSVDEPELFLEQHCWVDLDKDGYEEPYIVTTHHESKTLVRIVARYDMDGLHENSKGKIMKIEPVEYFTPFFFIPSPSGKFYALGFAHLLGPINESMNTALNQLFDAGTLANMQGGFIGRGIRMKGGTMSFTPGEWKVVDSTGSALKDNIVPMPTREPSMVLFQLLGMLNDAGMKLASVSETMTGETPSQNTPATTTLAVIEQGLKVFTAIYKRVFRSLTQEFKKLHRLNRVYLDNEEYYTVLDVNQKVLQKDYEVDDLDIAPVADPTLASEAQRLARVEALMGTYQLNPTTEGKLEILRQYYEGLQAANIEKLMPPQDEQGVYQMPQPPPDPEAIKTQLLAVKQKQDSDHANDEHDINMVLLEEKVNNMKADTKKKLADADSKPIMDQLSALNAQVSAMHNETKLQIEREKANGNSGPERNSGGAAGMAGPPDNMQGAEVSAGVPGLAGGAVGSGGDAGA